MRALEAGDPAFVTEVMRALEAGDVSSTSRTPTSSSTRPARGAWPAARKRARTPRVRRKADAERGPHRRIYGLLNHRSLELGAVPIPRRIYRDMMLVSSVSCVGLSVVSGGG